MPYKSAPAETLVHVQAIAAASGLPITVYNNPVAYGVDVTLSMFERKPADGRRWLGRWPLRPFPKETVAIWKLVQVGRLDEALAIYRWFGPWFDLDISTNLVQNIKLAESFAIDTKDRVRAPRLPLEGSERQSVAAIIEKALATRLVLPTF